MVVHELVHDISRGDLQRWTDVPHEADLIKRYGVGRASLREALQVLEVLEVISQRRGPRGGPTVLSPGHHGFARMTSLFLQMRRVTLAEVVDCWMALEPTVVRLAAQRRGSAQLAALAPQLADVPLEEDTAFLEVARQLHHAVLRAAGNSLVELLVDALAQLIVDRIGRFLLPVDQRAAWMCDLQGLLAAVLAGRPEQAEAHLAHLLRRLRAHLDHRPTVLEQPIVWR